MEKSKKIQILKDMIHIQSVNGNEKAVADYLGDLFHQNNIQTKQIEYAKDRTNLVAEIGASQHKILAFSGHMDVVAPGDLKLWDFDPFSATEKEGKIFGRGACDMKSGLAAMAIAMIELVEEKAILNGRIRLLATVGEEIGELGAEQLTKEGYVDDVNAMIIGEPSGYRIVYAHQGSLNFTVTSIGKSSHSSMPELGSNAIDHLNEFYSRANHEFRKEIYIDSALGKFNYNVTLISGGEQVNSIPEKAYLSGNIRTIPAFNNDKSIQLLTQIVDELNQKEGYQLILTIDANKSIVESQKESTIAKLAKSIAEKKIGKEVPLSAMPGTTDAAEFVKAKNEFPIIIFGPGNNTPHQVNEYIEIDNYLDMIDLYKEIATSYLV